MLTDIKRPVNASVVKSIWRSILQGTADFLGMDLGINAAWINSYSRAHMFSNLMYNSGRPARVSGTGTYEVNQGSITTSDPTAVSRIYLADQRGYLIGLEGTYTVLNPDGCNIAIGDFNVPVAGNFTTATEFTFEITSADTAGQVFLGLYVKGNLSGNVAVILPNHKTSYLAGNPWSNHFLSFYQQLGVKYLRAMDWTMASQNIEQDWSDRTQLGFPSLWNHCGQASMMPYELMCDLARRTQLEIWVCVPVRATQDYINQMAAFFAANYPSGRKLHVEYANEIWNWANPWGQGSRWVTSLPFTRYTAATTPGSDVFTLVGHGLTSAERVYCYKTREDSETGWNGDGNLTGGNSYVKVLTPDTFELYTTAGLTTKIAVTNKPNLFFHKVVEAGKVEDINLHYSTRCLQIWDAFDAALGAERVDKIVAGQAADSSKAAGRLAVATIPERASSVAIAPYFDGIWWGAKAVASNLAVTPSVWISQSTTVYLGLYPAAATPTIDQVIAATGAITSQTYVYTYSDDANWRQLTAMSGLVNGTAYKLHAVIVEGTVKRRLIVDTTPNVSTSTTFATTNYTEQSLINDISAHNIMSYVDAHKALSSVPLICYEGGLHYHHKAPAEMITWRDNYQESAEFGEANRRYLNRLAKAGVQSFYFYADCLGNAFSLADSYFDVTDERFKTYASFKGKVASGEPLNVENIIGINIKAEPATFPYTFHTFESVNSCQIISGNEAGLFSTVGNQLVMTNDIGVDWETPKPYNLLVQAATADTTDYVTVQFALGDAWYETDASLAWSPFQDTNTTQINPAIGGVIPLLEGVAATSAGGFWDMDGAYYGSTTAMSPTVVKNRETLFMAVIDRDNQVTGSAIVKFGGSNFIRFSLSTNQNTLLEVYTTKSGLVQLTCPPQTAGPHVLWMYYNPTDGRVYGGIDDTEYENKVANFGTGNFASDVYVGGQPGITLNSNAKHGAMQVVNRDGMTKASAISIVSGVMEYYSIS